MEIERFRFLMSGNPSNIASEHLMAGSMVFGVSLAWRDSCTSHAVRGRTVGIIDGDTIKVLTAAKQQTPVRIALLMRQRKVSRSVSDHN
jgi:hypothetical protein